MVPQENSSLNMPIRALYPHIIQRLQDLNVFSRAPYKAFTKREFVSSVLVFEQGKQPVKTPYTGIESQAIWLPETYLSYLWAMCYSFQVIHDEGLKQVSGVREDGKHMHLIAFNNEKLLAAEKLQEWAMGLSEAYSDWPDNLPNPEKYPDKDSFYIEHANGLFVNAAIFVVLHEWAHLENHHGETIKAFKQLQNPTDDDVAIIQRIEYEADQYAIARMLAVAETETERARIGFPIVITLCANLLLLREWFSIKSSSHPDADMRIVNVLEAFGINEERYLVTIRTIVYNAFMIFRNRHGLNFQPDLEQNVERLIDDVIDKLALMKQAIRG